MVKLFKIEVVAFTQKAANPTLTSRSGILFALLVVTCLVSTSFMRSAVIGTQKKNREVKRFYRCAYYYATTFFIGHVHITSISLEIVHTMVYCYRE